jgi:hypothetical protein
MEEYCIVMEGVRERPVREPDVREKECLLEQRPSLSKSLVSLREAAVRECLGQL